LGRRWRPPGRREEAPWIHQGKEGCPMKHFDSVLFAKTISTPKKSTPKERDDFMKTFQGTRKSQGGPLVLKNS